VVVELGKDSVIKSPPDQRVEIRIGQVYLELTNDDIGSAKNT